MADLDESIMQQDAGGGGERWNNLDNVAGQGAAGSILNASTASYNNAGSNQGYFDSGAGESPFSNMDFGSLGGGYGGGLGDLSFSGSDPWMSFGSGNDFYEPGFWGDNSFDTGTNYVGDYGNYTPSSNDVSNMYGKDAYGERYAEENKGNDLLKKYKDSVSPLQGFLKNPIVSTLMGLHPGTAALRAILGGPTSVGGFLGSMFGSNPLAKLAGGIGGSQLANYATEGQFAPMSGQTLGGIGGTMLGMASGNPYGGLAGGLAGRQIGGMDFGQNTFMPGETGGMPNSSGGGMANPIGMGAGNSMMGGMDMGGMGQAPNLLQTGMGQSILGAGATAGMGYNNNRMLSNQINTLEGLFGQNSSYAQQMRQQLDRRDAAAGRRSQYGPREVELQALLAGNAAKLQPGLQQLYGQKMGNTNLMVQSLLRNPQLMSGLKDAGGWLSNLFGGGGTVANNPYWNQGGFQSGNEGMGD